MRGVILCVALFILATATAFDFDDDEVVTDAPGGKAAADASDSESAGLTIAVTHTLGTAAPSVRGHLFVRAGVGATGKVTLRTSQAKLDQDGIDAVKALAASGGVYTLSLPSVLSDPSSPPVYASASACALLASRFEEHLQLTMSGGKDRVLALSYTLPVVPATCPVGAGVKMPRLALDEVLFNTTAVIHYPDEGAKPLGKIHDAAFLPQAAQQAAMKAQQAAGAAGGQGGGADGEGPPQPPQSFLRKYWMYILPVVIMLTMGGDPPPEEGKGGEGGGGGGGGGGARPAAAGAGGAPRRR